MFNVKENTIVYVVCPSFYKTGGTELAHQLVYEIQRQGTKAFITYYNDKSKVNKINPAFLEYVSNFVNIDDIIDNSDNIIVLPEIKPNLLDNFKHIQKCVWWMSVDNYLKINGVKGYYKCFGFARTFKHLILGHIKVGGYKINKEIVHLYQSEYAHQFLKSNSVNKTHQLSDYINKAYFTNTNKVVNSREDNVLYNPLKGIRFTKILMKHAPEINWVPIQNMTTNQVKELLLKSKVYIDFGNHPGKDRFPREAAISGCCVITGKRGSAKFNKDIPIENDFKFNDTYDNVEAIIKQIKLCISDYKNQSLRFEKYKEYIKSEYGQFSNDVNELFGVVSKRNSLNEGEIDGRK